MFEGQPKGLFALALANTGERFGYYTMLAVFALFLRANYGLSPAMAGTIYSSFLMFVYFFPLIGGMMADKFGFGRMVTTGIIIMFAGYLLLSGPLGGDTVALVVSEFVNEIAFLSVQRVVRIKIDDLFGAAFPENQVFFVNSLQKHFRKNKYTVVYAGIVVITDIVDDHRAFNILQSVNALKNIFHISGFVLVSFDYDAHYLLIFSG